MLRGGQRPGNGCVWREKNKEAPKAAPGHLCSGQKRQLFTGRYRRAPSVQAAVTATVVGDSLPQQVPPCSVGRCSERVSRWSSGRGHALCLGW